MPHRLGTAVQYIANDMSPSRLACRRGCLIQCIASSRVSTCLRYHTEMGRMSDADNECPRHAAGGKSTLQRILCFMCSAVPSSWQCSSGILVKLQRYCQDRRALDGSTNSSRFGEATCIHCINTNRLSNRRPLHAAAQSGGQLTRSHVTEWSQVLQTWCCTLKPGLYSAIAVTSCRGWTLQTIQYFLAGMLLWTSQVLSWYQHTACTYMEGATSASCSCKQLDQKPDLVRFHATSPSTGCTDK
jgi:hypothetical protein